MKPIKPIELSARDHRRILEWAIAGAVADVEKIETELARHIALREKWPEEGDTVITPSLIVPEMEQPRWERIDNLHDVLWSKRETLARLRTIYRQYRSADNERSAIGIAESVMANRRAERKAEDDARSVGEP